MSSENEVKPHTNEELSSFPPLTTTEDKVELDNHVNPSDNGTVTSLDSTEVVLPKSDASEIAPPPSNSTEIIPPSDSSNVVTLHSDTTEVVPPSDSSNIVAPPSDSSNVVAPPSDSTSTPPSNQSPPSNGGKEGWLWKKGNSTVANWQRRFFVVTPESITYYQDQNKKNKKGSFLCSEILEVGPIDHPKKKFCVALKREKNLFVVNCEDEQDRQTWIAEFKKLQPKDLDKDTKITKSSFGKFLDKMNTLGQKKDGKEKKSPREDKKKDKSNTNESTTTPIVETNEVKSVVENIPTEQKVEVISSPESKPEVTPSEPKTEEVISPEPKPEVAPSEPKTEEVTPPEPNPEVTPSEPKPEDVTPPEPKPEVTPSEPKPEEVTPPEPKHEETSNNNETVVNLSDEIKFEGGSSPFEFDADEHTNA